MQSAFFFPCIVKVKLRAFPDQQLNLHTVGLLAAALILQIKVLGGTTISISIIYFCACVRKSKWHHLLPFIKVECNPTESFLARSSPRGWARALFHPCLTFINLNAEFAGELPGGLSGGHLLLLDSRLMNCKTENVILCMSTQK